jgi:hypothetical protein
MHRLLLVALASACCQLAAAASCQVLLVGGEPGSAIYQRRFQDWLTRSHAVLVKGGVPAANIRLLSADPAFKAPIVNGTATPSAVVAELAAIAGRTGRDDQFVCIVVGHGTLVEGAGPRLLLPGPDLQAAEFAAAMAAIPCREQVVINLSGIAGSWIADLAAAERVNIAATCPGETPDPVFGEFLLRALEGRADGDGGGPKDGRIDCLEAFTWASRETVHWIARARYNGEADSWRIDGRESVALFEKLFGGIAGVPGARKLDPASDRNAADAVPLVQPPDGRLDAAWDGRRQIDEHAMLEDCGVSEGVPALGTTGFTVFPADQALQPGHLARRIVPGRPAGKAP